MKNNTISVTAYIVTGSTNSQLSKILIFLILITTTFPVIAQDKLLDILPLQNGSVTYTEIVQVDSVNKNSLYIKAKKWFVDTYKSAKDVIQLDDKENGEIMGKGNFKINYYTRDPYISHTISILVKDGRFKYIITGFSYSDNQNNKFTIENFPKSWFGKKKLYTKIDEEVKSLIASIKILMTTKDDW